MPKIKYQPPKYCKVKVGKKRYAAVYLNGKTIYLGHYGSPESKIAYTRFVAQHKSETALYVPEDKTNVTVKALALSYLDHVQGTISSQSYGHNRSAIRALLPLYGDDTLVGSFTPSCLKLFRQELIHSKRLCRKMINNHTRRIVSMFSWGVEEELVLPNTEAALKAVKSLPEGYPGTFDHPEREDVPDEIIIRTLPFMPPVVQAMVKVQRLTGMRPGEVFKMKVGEIDKKADPELWLYRLPTHKTQKKTKRKKSVWLSTIEQALIAPYLENKSPDAAVFSHQTAQKQSRRCNEFYNKDSYRNAVVAAIDKANQVLPDEEKIPHWTPYQLRHSASSAMEVEEDGIDKAQALLGHTTPNMTAKYNHRQMQKAKKLAKERQNVFGDE